MGSLLEELTRREAAARRRIEGLRQQISELIERLGSEEDRLSRLVGVPVAMKKFPTKYRPTCGNGRV